MANRVYDKAVGAFLKKLIDWENDDIRAILIDLADYTPDLAAHEFLSSVPGAARVSTAALAGRTVTGRVVDAADTTFSAVTGDQSEAILLYLHTGNDATARLIFLVDTASSGIPVTPNGGDILVQWDNGANKVFKL